MARHQAIASKVENLIPNCLVNLSPSAVNLVLECYKKKGITNRLEEICKQRVDIGLKICEVSLYGRSTSKIIVTTRSVDVALTLGPIDDDCWSTFVKHAFENRDTSAHQNLELIREKVVENCKGLPQAAANLGGLLRYKQRDDEWQDILNSRIWDLSEKATF